MLGSRKRGQKALGLGSEVCPAGPGREQGEGLQAAGGQDLAAHHESLAPLVLGQQDLKRLQVPWHFLHLVLLACFVVGINEGDVFTVEVLYTIIHQVYQGCLPLVLPGKPKGAIRWSQDGIGLVQGEVSILELGEPIQTGGLE